MSILISSVTHVLMSDRVFRFGMSGQINLTRAGGTSNGSGIDVSSAETFQHEPPNPMKGQLPNESNRIRGNIVVAARLGALTTFPSLSTRVKPSTLCRWGMGTEAPLDFLTITAHSVDSRSRFIRSVTRAGSRREKASHDFGNTFCGG